MKQIRKILLGIAAIALVTTGVTLAYLSDVTTTKVNAFSSNKQLSILLREMSWDGFDFTDHYPENTAPGQVAKDPTNSNLGINQAKNYYPGDSISKNPSVMNMADSEDAYVAIKVEYLIVKDDVTEILTSKEFNESYGKTVSSNSNNAVHSEFVNISKNDSYDLYMYGTQLASNDVTPAVFDNVVINSDIVPDNNGKLPNFQIKVTAYAVQSKNVNTSTAIDELNNLANK